MSTAFFLIMESLQHLPHQRIQGAKSLILCVHGIQGSPNQFRPLLASLPMDADYRCVLLPGHGEGLRSFSRVNDKDWLPYVIKLCREACQSYESVIYVGHSMGCLLGLLAGMETEVSFKGMLLLACPIKLRFRMRYLINGCRSIRGNSAHPAVAAMREANSVTVSHPLSYLLCLKPYLGLLKLMRTAKKKLSQVQHPLCLVFSKEDEIVSPRSAHSFLTLSEAKVVLSEKDGHYLYTESTKDRIRDELLSILS